MRVSQSPQPFSLFNTQTSVISRIEPIDAGKIRLYACGPTVYKHAHIGNLRTYIFEDVLARALRYADYDVSHVMNITDVGHLQSDADQGEDKMSLAAIAEQRSPWEIAKFYEAEFFRHAGLLNIAPPPPDTVCRATEHIAEMIDMASTLEHKGYAYQSEGNLYFDIAKFPQYANFARLNLDETEAQARVEIDQRKRHQADFVLWFSQSKFPHQIMKWDSPWGSGFPGWHIECSAMASKYLGHTIDIHCGGIDHIGVHHSNEIAQSECCFGQTWVNTWFHCGFLELNNAKMSKSTGDFLTVDSLLAEGFDPLAYRYLVLTSHYRGSLVFSFEVLKGAASAFEGLRRRVADMRVGIDESNITLPDVAPQPVQDFYQAILNDLHTPTAMASLWAVVKSTDIAPAHKIGYLRDFDQILGLNLMVDQTPTLTTAQEQLLAERAAARTAGNWARADEIRALLTLQGVGLRDGKL